MQIPISLPMEHSLFPMFDYHPTSSNEVFQARSQLPWAKSSTSTAVTQPSTINEFDTFSMPSMLPGWADYEYDTSNLTCMPVNNEDEDW